MKKENRETYLARVIPLMSPRDATMAELAYELTKNSFRPHKRKGEKDPLTGEPVRSFEHCRRVSLILLDEVCCAEPSVVCGGMLHDCEEDTRFLKVAKIEFIFGPEIARIVRMLSKQEFADGSRDIGYTDRLAKYGDWPELLIKGCDRLDNLRTLGGCNNTFILKQITETQEKYFALTDLMYERVPVRYKVKTDEIREKIRRLVAEYQEQLRTRHTS